MRGLFCFFITIGFAACSDNVSNKDIRPDSGMKDKIVQKRFISQFDTARFCIFLNNYVPKLTKTERPYSLTTNSFSDSSFMLHPELLFSRGAEQTRFKFDCGDYFKSVDVIKTSYTDTSAAKTILKKLDDASSGKNPEYKACLSKTNDFVYRIQHEIYWVNLACYFPFQRAKEIAHEFCLSLNRIPQDSVVCKCGGQKIM